MNYEKVELAISQVQQLYFEDEFPLFIGYSGEKIPQPCYSLFGMRYLELKKRKETKRYT